MKEEATEIEFIFQPKTMTDVDMIAGTFEIIGFLDLEWIDTRLSWSSQEMKEMIFIKNYYLNILWHAKFSYAQEYRLYPCNARRWKKPDSRTKLQKLR